MTVPGRQVTEFYRACREMSDNAYDRFKLTADNIETVRNRANVNFGDTVYFHIRYHYDITSTNYGEWVSRPLQLTAANTSPLPSPAGWQHGNRRSSPGWMAGSVVSESSAHGRNPDTAPDDRPVPRLARLCAMSGAPYDQFRPTA